MHRCVLARLARSKANLGHNVSNRHKCMVRTSKFECWVLGCLFIVVGCAPRSVAPITPIPSLRTPFEIATRAKVLSVDQVDAKADWMACDAQIERESQKRLEQGLDMVTPLDIEHTQSSCEWDVLYHPDTDYPAPYPPPYEKGVQPAPFSPPRPADPPPLR